MKVDRGTVLKVVTPGGIVLGKVPKVIILERIVQGKVVIGRITKPKN
jgi:hypothetical protein